MGFKQPRVPEYRENENVGKFLKALVLFLKDFCQEVWTASRLTQKGLNGISYPVTSVNKKTGDVTLDAADVGAVNKSGDEMTGDFYAPRISLKDSSGSRTHHYINIYKANVANYVARIQFRLGDGMRRFSFIQAHNDQDNAADVYKEYYNLPTVDANLSSDADYSILTSKKTVTIEQGGTGATTKSAARAALGALAEDGTAASATKLATERTIHTNLASTSATSFDGTKNITPGVTGTLPLGNGGTGATTAAAARDKLGLYTTLWEGSWASGTITVPNTSDYNVFKLGMSGQGTTIIAVRQGSHIRGVGGYTTDSPWIVTFHFAATYSGDVWTFVACNSMAHTSSGSHEPASEKTVTSIVGVV